MAEQQTAVYRGLNRSYVTGEYQRDARKAAAGGYVPVSESWREEDGESFLTVVYEQRPGSAAWATPAGGGRGPEALLTSADGIAIRHIEAGQDTEGLQRVAREVAKILTPSEEILYVALQNVTALSIKKDAVVVTTNRIIGFSPGVLGRVSFHDYLWQDVLNVSMKQGILSTEIIVETAAGKQEVGAIDKEQAKRLYGLAQQLEQEWREKRRMREMEESRARAGGVYMGALPSMAAAAPAVSPAPDAADPVAKLGKAKAMLDQGLISEAEYETLKAKVLSEF